MSIALLADSLLLSHQGAQSPLSNEEKNDCCGVCTKSIGLTILDIIDHFLPFERSEFAHTPVSSCLCHFYA